MTLVATVTNSMVAWLVADSRLTWQDQNDPSRRNYRDVCQKVVRLGNDALIGFAGNVYTAWKVLRVITGTYKRRGTSWLKDEGEIEDLFSYLNVRKSDPPASFIVMFIDKEHCVRPGTPGALVIQFATDERKAVRSYLGLHMIGSGSVIKKDIDRDPGLVNLLNFAGAGNDPRKVAMRALFLAEVVAETAREKGIQDVGGLFQICFVLRSGVHALPYERWVDLGDGMGTWVSMEINDDGQWVQVHEPSGLRMPLGAPYQDDFTLQDSHVNRTFDLSEKLHKESPGVIPRTNPQQIYRPCKGGPWVLRVP